jgi:hypothetical protein
MKDFFSLKRLGLSFVIFLGTGFIVYVVSRGIIDVPSGPGSLAAGMVALLVMLVVFAIAFPITDFLSGRYLFGESAGTGIGYAFLDLILFSIIFVAGFYAYGELDNYWQETYS